jgi:hypothetical protein
MTNQLRLTLLANPSIGLADKIRLQIEFIAENASNIRKKFIGEIEDFEDSVEVDELYNELYNHYYSLR